MRLVSVKDHRLPCYPAKPTRMYLMWKIARYLGLKTSPCASACPGLGYAHIDATTCERIEGNDPGGGVWILNGECVDIRKRHVAELFAEVFGYGYSVDPLTHQGPMLVKSEENGVHDGRIVNGPLAETDPNLAYQKVLDSVVEDSCVIDLRPCVIGNQIAFVLRKRRPLEDRFETFISSQPDTAENCFSADEIDKILQFCRRIGMDMGELDIIRTADDGRIYIVDVNKTPHSPTDNLVNWVGIVCMIKAARCFRDEFMRPMGEHTDERKRPGVVPMTTDPAAVPPRAASAHDEAANDHQRLARDEIGGAR